MAISITKFPEPVCTTRNPIVWGIESDQPDALLEIQVFQYIENPALPDEVLLFKTKLPPKAGERNKFNFNLQTILDAVVKPDVNNGGFIALAKPANYIKYTLFLREIYFSGGTQVPAASTTTTGYRIGLEGELDVYEYTNKLPRQFYSDISYYGSSTDVRFLTNRPKCEKMNKFSSHQLYWANYGWFNNSNIQMVMELNGTTQEGFTLQNLGYSHPLLCLPAVVEIDVSTFPEFPVSGSCAFTSIGIQNPQDPTGPNIPIRYYQGNISQTASGYCQTLADAINSSNFTVGNGYKFRAECNGNFLRVWAPSQTCCEFQSMNLEFSYEVDSCNQGNQYSLSFPMDFCSEGILPSLIQFNFTEFTRELFFPTIFSNLVAGDIIKFWLIWENTGGRITEEWCFVWEDVECDKEYVNILFTNSYGGVDTLQFISPKINYNISKKQITKNQINISKPFQQEFLDNFNGDPNSTVSSGYTPFNVEKLTYDSTTNAELTLYTKFLNENESDQIFELLRSRNVYIEMLGQEVSGKRNGGQLLPAIITTTEQELRRKKIIKDNLVQYEIKMTVAADNIDILDRIIFKES